MPQRPLLTRVPLPVPPSGMNDALKFVIGSRYVVTLVGGERISGRYTGDLGRHALFNSDTHLHYVHRSDIVHYRNLTPTVPEP